MVRPKKSQRSDVEVADLNLEQRLEQSLEKAFDNFNLKLDNILTKNFDKVVTSVTMTLNENVMSLNENISIVNANVRQLCKSLVETPEKDINVEENVNQGHAEAVSGCQNNKKYISMFKELGGSNLHFSPTGTLHPVMFLKKLSTMFHEAGVPSEKRVYFSVNCLRGSAQDWADITDFDSFEHFKDLFLKRYWDIEKERETFSKVKFGKFENGSMADYFLKVVKEAKFLTQPLTNDELIGMVSNHFSVEVRRGIINSGFKNIEEVENHLRKLDTVEEGAETNNRVQRMGNYGGRENRYNQYNRSGPSRQGFQNNVNRQENHTNSDRRGNNDSTVSTIFNQGFEDVLEENVCDVKAIAVVPTIDIKLETLSTRCLVDSGSQVTAISENFFEIILREDSEIPRLPARCTTLVGALGCKSTKVREQVFLSVQLNGFKFEYPFLIVPNLVRNCILGCDWMRDYSVIIDFSKSVLRGNFDGTERQICFVGEPNPGIYISVSEVVEQITEPPQKRKELTCYAEEALREVAENAESLNESHKIELFSLLLSYREIFSDQPGRTEMYMHQIRLHDYRPFFLKSYPIPYAYKQEVRRQIDEMLKWGVIRCCQTEYVSPLVVVKKKDNTIRVCLDARYLNSRMVKDHAMPFNPCDFLFNFTEGQCLSTLDLTSSYWQIPILPDHQKYTGFSYEGQTYVFQVLPFGLSTSVGSFIRGLMIILGPDVEEWVIPYVDDLLIYSENAEVHLNHLKILFEKFRKAGITVKLRKSHFGRTSVNFLGHIVSPTGIQMDPDRVRAIQEFPTPRNVKHLKSFLGVINYDARFCKDFSKLTVPLIRLLKKGSIWKWGVEEADAFKAVKSAFLRDTILAHPANDKMFYIQSDSSGYAVGACLFQLDEVSGRRNVVAFASRTMHGAELTYTVTEKEALAVVFALRKWRVFVLDRQLTILTDHKALSFIKSCRLLNGRLTRWIMYIQEFNFQIQYCKGSENVVADALSRYPIKDAKNHPIEIPDNTEISIGAVKQTVLSKEVSFNMSHIGAGQKTDEFCKETLKILNTADAPVRIRNWFVIFNGLLFKKGTNLNPGHKLCIPVKHTRALILQEHQENGHFGANKCILQLSKYYFWPKMRRICRKLLASCDICQKSKISPHLLGEMHSVVPIGINDIVCLDLMGPLPVSRSGATQLLVVIDAFSKYVELYPLCRATTKSILRCLTSRYFSEIGKPRIILSDNGTQFSSHLWSETLKQQDVTVRHTSVYFPQGNLTERINREIGRLLRTLCFAQHTKWATVIKDINIWLNRVIHSGTAFSPETVHFGRVPPNNFTDKIEFPDAESSKLPNNTIITLAYENLLSKAKKRKLRYEKNKKLVKFEIGDKVLVRTHPQSCAETKEIRKFFLLYRGPGTITDIRGPNSYFIVDDASGVPLGVQNIVNLKKYVEEERVQA